MLDVFGFLLGYRFVLFKVCVCWLLFRVWYLVCFVALRRGRLVLCCSFRVVCLVGCGFFGGLLLAGYGVVWEVASFVGYLVWFVLIVLLCAL